ncbi:hypothetical protein PCYB_007660, partial [Plasmodium cynomolgi strain B]
MSEYNSNLEFWRNKVEFYYLIFINYLFIRSLLLLDTILEYPFLDELWNMYIKFNEPDIDDTIIQSYEYLCNDVPTQSTENPEKHNDFCKKLIKNLVSYKFNGNYDIKDINKSEDFNNFMKFCGYLNNWLYFENKKWKLSDELINDIFKIRIVENGKVRLICPYFRIDKDYITNENLIDLYVFSNNIEIIMNIYAKEIEKDDCIFKQFILNCILIYKSTCGNFENITQLKPSDDYVKCLNFKKFLSKLTEIKTKYGYMPTLNSKDIDKFLS